jgi:hypothetical protein
VGSNLAFKKCNKPSTPKLTDKILKTMTIEHVGEINRMPIMNIITKNWGDSFYAHTTISTFFASKFVGTEKANGKNILKNYFFLN